MGSNHSWKTTAASLASALAMAAALGWACPTVRAQTAQPPPDPPPGPTPPAPDPPTPDPPPPEPTAPEPVPTAPEPVPTAPEPPPPPPIPPPVAPPPPPPGPPLGPPPPPPGRMGWGPDPMPPALPVKPPALPGATESGVPLAQQGRIGLDTASFLNSDGHSSATSFNVVATVPVADHTFVEAIMPLSLVYPWGNPTIGGHHVARLAEPFWLTGGGSIGIPLIEDDAFLSQAIPRGLWNAHHHVHDILPLQVRLGLEYHVSIVELRAQLEPSLWIPIARNDDVHGAFYHAAEIQLGHSIGGGLRVQGVAYGPGYGSVSRGRLSGGSDYYQLSLSPFFVVNRDLGFLRLGIMMPMDEGLGPPFEESWGFLFATGINID